MKVLSLFDGMACGMLAMQAAGIEVDRYVAFEIDKYAVQTSAHNFPMIEHRGDVFKADFTEFSGFDFLVGGSPCTYWSIAQKNNRETEASGMGWELFSQYVRALREAQPKFFIYENNKSMAKAIRESITETFGFEPICINSALVSAQNRQRLYWVGKRNPDGTYSRVHVDQPEDRGILLRDVLDGLCWKDKAYTIDSNYHKTLGQQGFERQSGRRKMVAEPVAEPFGETDGKAYALTASYWKGQPKDKILEKSQRTHVAEPVRIPEYGLNDKARCVTASYAYKGSGAGSLVSEAFPDNPNKQVRDYVAEPCRVGTWPNNAKNQAHDSQQYRIYNTDGKGVTLCGNGGGMGERTGLYAIPVKEDNVLSDEYWHGGFDGPLVGMVETPMTARNGKQPSQHCRVYSCEDKFVCLGIDSRNRVIVPYYGYATPCEWDEDGKPITAVSGTDGKTYPVYEVKDGQITIKGKQYPIKLEDGYYIIRKLTVSECKRLQTVPDWYEFPVSDTQAYKMLGNGWTVEVIAHLINATQIVEAVGSDEHQINLFEMVGE